MFFGSFAWSFVFVSLPFHIQRVSTLDATSTLRWTGWILGITSLVTVVTAPIWGRYAARGNPKACYVAVESLQGLGFFVMALARTLPETAHLTELRLENATLRIIGLADNAPALLAPLEQSGHMTNVRFFAPTTRGPDGKLFRFHIEAQVEPHMRIAEE